MGLIRAVSRSARRGRNRRGGWRWDLVFNIIPEVIAAVEENAVDAVAETAADIARDAQARAPVQSGALRASIVETTNGKEGEVSAGAEYAAFVEYGTYKMGAQPFLYPAVMANEEKFTDRVGKGWLADF